MGGKPAGPIRSGSHRRSRSPRGHWVLVSLLVLTVTVGLLIEGFTRGVLGENSADEPRAGGPAAPAAVLHGGAVLSATGPHPRSYAMPPRTVALMTDAASLPPEVALRRFVENALAPGSTLVGEVLACRQEHPPDPAGWQAQAAAGATWDADGRLARIAAPTLVLTGTADAVVDPRNSPLLAERIANAELETIEGAGHLVFWERTEEFAALVERFLG